MSRPRVDSKKQMQVISYIKKKGSVDQSKIVHYFFGEFGYKTLPSARVAVGRMLKNIENQGLATKKTAMNESSGSIEKNIWSAK